MQHALATDERTGAGWYSLGAILLGVSLLVRALVYSVTTSDYSGFLVHWYQLLAGQGFHAFAQPFADYAPLYLYFLQLLSYFPADSLYAIKTLSLFFDGVIAFFIYRITYESTRFGRGFPFFAAALAFTIPTVLINTSLWGQSDSVYAAGIIASLYFLLRKQFFLGTIAFALALAIKLQAIFFLPIIVGLLARQPRKLLYLIAVPAVFVLSLVPALIGGGSLNYWGLIYLHQSGEYPWLSVSAPSIFAFTEHIPLAGTETLLFYIGVSAAGLVALSIVLYLRNRRALGVRELLLLSLICVLALPYLLPRMHERYFYLADILSVLYALYTPKQWYVPVLMVLSSLLAYVPYLSSQVPWLSGMFVDLRIPASVLLLLLLLLLISLASITFGRRSPALPPHPRRLVPA